MATTAKFEEKDLGWRKIKREMKRLDRSFTMVGFPGDAKAGRKSGGSISRNKHPAANGTMTVAQLAAIHEYGSPANKIPSRPFMKQTADSTKVRREVNNLIVRGLRKVQDGKLTAKKALSQLGEYYGGQIKKMITNGNFKDLKPATKARKKSTKPLIDTSIMRNSVTHKEMIW